MQLFSRSHRDSKVMDSVIKLVNEKSRVMIKCLLLSTMLWWPTTWKIYTFKRVNITQNFCCNKKKIFKLNKMREGNMKYDELIIIEAEWWTGVFILLFSLDLSLAEIFCIKVPFKNIYIEKYKVRMYKTQKELAT